tara:strand:+ start:733 stop:1479 length:747 start_codon:yes stop_codon:yes gene_type:complete
MSFIPENTPFIALPTALKGKVTPNQLSVIWVLQSYYPNIWPSYQTIAKDAMMSPRTVIRTVDQLVKLGLLQKQIRIDENNQRTNCYRVAVWQHFKPTPVIGPSVTNRGVIESQGYDRESQGVCQKVIAPMSQSHPKKNNITKTNNYKNKSFEPFWKTYLEIPKNMRTISLSKKPAYNEFMKLDAKTRDKLKDCLEADIRARTKQLKQDKFSPLFPDAHRWISKGQYEQYLLTATNKAVTFKKPKNTPF